MVTIQHFQSMLSERQLIQPTLYKQPRTQLICPESRQSYSHEALQALPAWLNTIIEDSSPPPKLFAWTAASLTLSPTCPSEMAPRSASKRIYVLGVGNLGRLLASSLSQSPSEPPITLVVHRRSLLEHWTSTPGIEITRNGKIERFTNFEVEWWTEQEPNSGPIRELAPIDNLIVATKAQIAMPQIDRVRRYLHSGSTVAFVQNGMCKLWGADGELYKSLRFPDQTGPSWLACVTTHGVSSLAHFKSLHSSLASMSLGLVSGHAAEGGTDHHYLLSQLSHAPHLSARIVSTAEIWALQVEKVVVNSVLNPLTAILNCENGELFQDRGDMLPQVIDALVQEASIVLTRLVLDPEGQHIFGGERVPGQDLRKGKLFERFSFLGLRRVVYDVMYKVRSHIGSMLQDVRAGRETEIQEYNGWLISTAESLGLGNELPTHRKIITMIENGGRLSRHQLVRYCLGDTVHTKPGPSLALPIGRL